MKIFGFSTIGDHPETFDTNEKAPRRRSSQAASGPFAALKPRPKKRVKPAGYQEPVDFAACAESKLRSPRQLSAMEQVRQPVEDQKSLLAAFGTAAQQNASSAKDIDDANEAALQEAIARSLQEKAFGILVQPELEVIQRGAIDTKNHASNVLANHSTVHREPFEVSDDQRAEQMLAFAEPNSAFKTYLERQNLKVIANPGKGNNCAIYALVQQIRPDLKPESLDREVRHLRDLYDTEHPSDKNKMLYFDISNGGAAKTLIRLVNERYRANIQVGVVEAGIEAGYPVTRKNPFSAKGAGSAFTHRLVVWDQQGHYEAVTAKPDRLSR